MFGLGAPEQVLILLVVLAVPAAIIGFVAFAIVKAQNRKPAVPPSWPGGPPPGWHPDPSGTPGSLRYWDGARWTDQTAAQ